MRRIGALALFALALFTGVFFQSCGDDGNTGSIPYVNVSVQIDLNDPTYLALNPFGGFEYIENHGNRGLVVFHNYDDTYSAFDRICSFQPSDACSRVELESGGLFYQCGTTDSEGEFEPCCGSKFDLQGFVLDGEATFPLQQYQVYKNGNLLTIRN